MDELLQQLLEADILSADTKKELEEAFNSKLEEAINAVKTETETTVKADLSEQWIDQRDSLIEAIDTKVSQFLEEELTELKEDIGRFRDLEAEYAEKVVEAKSQMGDELKGDLAELVEKLDTFLEIRLSSEMEELREDIQVQKENHFGRTIFEAIKAEYQNNYADSDDTAATLSETKSRLTDTETALEESETKLAGIQRTVKMNDVLSPLSGRAHDVMEAILANVSTEQLEEGYNTFLGRVLRESDLEEDLALNEGKDSDKKDDDKKDDDKKDKKDDKKDDDKKDDKKDLKESAVVTGDTEELIPASDTGDGLSESARSRLKLLSGL